MRNITIFFIFCFLSTHASYAMHGPGKRDGGSSGTGNFDIVPVYYCPHGHQECTADNVHVGHWCAHGYADWLKKVEAEEKARKKKKATKAKEKKERIEAYKEKHRMRIENNRKK